MAEGGLGRKYPEIFQCFMNASLEPLYHALTAQVQSQDVGIARFRNVYCIQAFPQYVHDGIILFLELQHQLSGLFTLGVQPRESSIALVHCHVTEPLAYGELLKYTHKLLFGRFPALCYILHANFRYPVTDSEWQQV